MDFRYKRVREMAQLITFKKNMLSFIALVELRPMAVKQTCTDVTG